MCAENRTSNFAIASDHPFVLGFLPNGHSIEPGWFAVNHALTSDDKRLRRRSYGKYWIISSEHGSVIRSFRCSPNLHKTLTLDDSGESVSEIAVDWKAWIILTDGMCGENQSSPVRLIFTSLPRYKLPVAWANHPSNEIRAAIYLAYLSIVLGLLSLSISIICWFQ